MKMILAAVIQIIAYACLISVSAFTDLDEDSWRFTVFIALPIVGAVSVWLFGKDGIIGNISILLLALFAYFISAHNKDALWVIGLLMILILHMLQAVAWALTLMMKKKAEQALKLKNIIQDKGHHKLGEN